MFSTNFKPRLRKRGRRRLASEGDYGTRPTRLLIRGTFKQAIRELETGTVAHVKLFTVNVLDKLIFHVNGVRTPGNKQAKVDVLLDNDEIKSAMTRAL